MKLFQKMLKTCFLSAMFTLAFSSYVLAIDESDFRYCTADAGSLMNDKGECKFYSNGCERSDLISAGYTNQCNMVHLNNPFVEIDDALAPLVETLPALNNINIKRTIQYGCDICDVEPMVFVNLQFTHLSCAERTFELTIDSNDTQKGVKNIYVKDLTLFDCFGAIVEHKYNFQWFENGLNSEAKYEAKYYTIANPVLN